MKKLFVVFAAVALVWAFTVPASAADWNFYGNARMATFWVSTDLGDGATVGGDDDDADLQWDLQGNSRVGASVKAENVSGRFELGLKGSDGGDVDVGTRRIEATWNFGQGSLTIGKTYSPINQFLSGQVFGGDAGLLGAGFMYGGRPGLIQLSFGGFKVALLTPKSDTLAGTTGDVDETLPKIDASYSMSVDNFNFAVRGGYQTYEIEGAAGGDIDVDSWLVAADAGVNFGAAYVKAGGSYAQNGGNARWTAGAGTVNAAVDDIDDNTTLQFGVVGGFKFTDQTSFEAGFGWREDDSDAPGAEEDDSWELYVQSVVQMAPGVFIIPEIGFRDEGDDSTGADEGDRWYAGAKWQINF